jgi:hypothetical protein
MAFDQAQRAPREGDGCAEPELTGSLPRCPRQRLSLRRADRGGQEPGFRPCRSRYHLPAERSRRRGEGGGLQRCLLRLRPSRSPHGRKRNSDGTRPGFRPIWTRSGRRARREAEYSIRRHSRCGREGESRRNGSYGANSGCRHRPPVTSTCVRPRSAAK